MIYLIPLYWVWKAFRIFESLCLPASSLLLHLLNRVSACLSSSPLSPSPFLCFPYFPSSTPSTSFSFSLSVYLFKLLGDVYANQKFIPNVWLTPLAGKRCVLTGKDHAADPDFIPALPVTSLWPWSSYSTSLSFSFPMWKIGTMMVIMMMPIS